MNIKPTQGRVLLKQIENSNETKSGLILSQSTNPEASQGEILEIGPLRKDQVVNFEVGNIGFFGNYSGLRLTEDDETYILLNVEDIVAYKTK